VLQINPTQADISGAGRGLSLAEFKCLIAANMQKRPGKQRHGFGIHAADDV